MSTAQGKPPVLPAYAFRDRWWVWCDHCATLHCHGAEPGHRTAHCEEKDSPYGQPGYTLNRVARVVKSFREMRPGRAPLHGFTERTRKGVLEARYQLLKSWLPRGVRLAPASLTPAGQFVAEIRIKDAVGRENWTIFVDLDTEAWHITAVELGARTPRCLGHRKGRGLDTLAEALFGVPAEIAARRIGEILGAGGDDDGTA